MSAPDEAPITLTPEQLAVAEDAEAVRVLRHYFEPRDTDIIGGDAYYHQRLELLRLRLLDWSSVSSFTIAGAGRHVLALARAKGAR